MPNLGASRISVGLTSRGAGHGDGTPHDPLRAWRSVPKLFGLPQRIDRFVDCQENSRFE
jgi:hypothetical protein